jgi:hypothetical protein
MARQIVAIRADKLTQTPGGACCGWRQFAATFMPFPDSSGFFDGTLLARARAAGGR